MHIEMEWLSGRLYLELKIHEQPPTHEPVAYRHQYHPCHEHYPGVSKTRTVEHASAHENTGERGAGGACLGKAEGVGSDDVCAEGVPCQGHCAEVAGLPHLRQTPLFQAVAVWILPALPHTGINGRCCAGPANSCTSSYVYKLIQCPMYLWHMLSFLSLESDGQCSFLMLKI